MPAASRPRRVSRTRTARHAYVLVARGPDDRLRLERFDDAQAYRARLMALPDSPGRAVSIDELVDLLDA